MPLPQVCMGTRGCCTVKTNVEAAHLSLLRFSVKRSGTVVHSAFQMIWKIEESKLGQDCQAAWGGGARPEADLAQLGQLPPPRSASYPSSRGGSARTRETSLSSERFLGRGEVVPERIALLCWAAILTGTPPGRTAIHNLRCRHLSEITPPKTPNSWFRLNPHTESGTEEILEEGFQF